MQAPLSFVAHGVSIDAVVLIVGDVGRWRKAGRTLPALDGLTFAEMGDLTACMLHTIAPDVILSPAIGASFDAVEVARLLHSVAYLGRYRAISDGLPNLALIHREVRLVAPGLDFSIMDVKELLL